MYMITHQILTSPTISNIKISTNSNAYISVNSPSILVKFWIQNLMTNPSKVYDTELNINYSKSQPLSVNSHLICIKLCILHLRINPNKVFSMERSSKLEQGSNLELSWKLELSWN